MLMAHTVCCPGPAPDPSAAAALAPTNAQKADLWCVSDGLAQDTCLAIFQTVIETCCHMLPVHR